jgi:hypothetical protein
MPGAVPPIHHIGMAWSLVNQQGKQYFIFTQYSFPWIPSLRNKRTGEGCVCKWDHQPPCTTNEILKRIYINFGTEVYQVDIGLQTYRLYGEGLRSLIWKLSPSWHREETEYSMVYHTPVPRCELKAINYYVSTWDDHRRQRIYLTA